ncbi:septal ring lytic transglycosylase RlpA family protein [Sphingomonas sp. I4]
MALLAAPVAAATTDGSASPRYGGYDATGRASWYGHELAGRRTATGKRFDPDDVMIAHRTLPLEIDGRGDGRRYGAHDRCAGGRPRAGPG